MSARTRGTLHATSSSTQIHHTEFKKLNMSLTRGSLADIKDDMCATEF